jgi:hypothetical protein
MPAGWRKIERELFESVDGHWHIANPWKHIGHPRLASAAAHGTAGSSPNAGPADQAGGVRARARRKGESQ